MSRISILSTLAFVKYFGRFPDALKFNAASPAHVRFAYGATADIRDGQIQPAKEPGAAGREALHSRVEVLVTEMLKDDGVRLTDARREALRRLAEADGIEVADALIAAWGG